ncbi:MAG: hypothetical protein WCK55_11585 [Verrucomicrobiota bacterium]|nr:hypothetical protein [Verrucomicrobiota bacterium]
MKTNTLRKLIIAGSLGVCAMAHAAPPPITIPALPGKPALGNFLTPPEITRPVIPRITPVPLPPRCPGPVHPVRPVQAHPTMTLCIPIPAQEKSKVLPRPFPMPDFTVRNLLTVTGNDSGCVNRPGKPIRPIPTPTRPRPNI